MSAQTWTYSKQTHQTKSTAFDWRTPFPKSTASWIMSWQVLAVGGRTVRCQSWRSANLKRRFKRWLCRTLLSTEHLRISWMKGRTRRLHSWLVAVVTQPGLIRRRVCCRQVLDWDMDCIRPLFRSMLEARTWRLFSWGRTSGWGETTVVNSIPRRHRWRLVLTKWPSLCRRLFEGISPRSISWLQGPWLISCLPLCSLNA